jgi:anti-repressor protein
MRGEVSRVMGRFFVNQSGKEISAAAGGHVVRTVVIGGEPHFVAKDVCDVLGLEQVSRALDRLDDDERGVTSMHTPGGVQQMSVINESGLYSLILGSRKPEARAFKKWVTSEVLPAIRKAGR